MMLYYILAFWRWGLHLLPLVLGPLSELLSWDIAMDTSHHSFSVGVLGSVHHILYIFPVLQ